jgi:hypothetical protein
MKNLIRWRLCRLFFVKGTESKVQDSEMRYKDNNGVILLTYRWCEILERHWFWVFISRNFCAIWWARLLLLIANLFLPSMQTDVTISQGLVTALDIRNSRWFSLKNNTRQGSCRKMLHRDYAPSMLSNRHTTSLQRQILLHLTKAAPCKEHMLRH